MMSCNACWSVTTWMRNTDIYIWFLWGCLVDWVLYFFALISTKENKPYTFRFTHTSGWSSCPENYLQNQRSLIFLEIPFQTISYFLKSPILNFKMVSVEGAMILIQPLMILEVLLIISLLKNSCHLHLHLVILICVTVLQFSWLLPEAQHGG